jgi:hypothetical protein
MKHWRRFALVTVAWAALGGQVGCARSEQSKAPRATTPDQAAVVSEQERPSLESAASKGDWRAAQRLALDRFWIAAKRDAELLRLWRIWAKGSSEGTVGLANLL